MVFTRDDSDIDEGFSKPGLAGTDGDIAIKGEIAAGADSRSLDGRNRRDVKAVQRFWNPLNTLYIAPPDAGGAAAEDSFLVTHILDVSASREGCAFRR